MEETKKAIEEAKTEITENTMVYHLDEEEEKLTEMVSSLNADGDIEMETDHFSIYIIVNFETIGIEVNVSHWANVKDFTLENGGLEDITSEEFKENHMVELDSRVERNPEVITNSDLIKVRLKELKYTSNFTNDISKYGLSEKVLSGINNTDYPIIDKYKKVPDKLFPGKIEKDGSLEYPTIYTQIYSSNTYMLPGWATKGIPYTILLDKLSKINNNVDRNYEIDKITFITDTSKDATSNRKVLVFKKSGDSYELESGELSSNSPIDDLSNPDGINKDDLLLELGQYNEVRFDYKETIGTSDVDVAFHDYNLGEMYIDDQGYRIAEGWWDSSKYDGYNGINAPIVYKKIDGNTENVIEDSNKLGRIYIGGGEARLGFSAFSNSEGKYATVPLNKNFNNPVIGYAKKKLDSKDSYDVFTIKDPGLFYPGDLYSKYTYKDKETHLDKDTGEEVEVDVKKEVEVLAKEYLPGYKIGFNRVGDTYVINNVKNPSGKEVLSDLDVLRYTGAKYYINYPLYSNMFWPLDELGDRQNGGQDQLKPLDKDSLYQKDQSGNFSQNDEDTAESKTIRHNWLFGMNFNLEFNVKEYTGPLNYYFKGDDDLFVYVDGELMIDIGGIHSSYGTFINVKDWLVEKGLAERNPNNNEEIIPLVDGVQDPDHKYTMSVFYTERGGTGSCCYMMYTLPKVKPVEIPIYDTLQHTINKTWNDGGNVANRPSEINIQIYQNGEPYGEQMTLSESDITNDNQTWKYIWNNLPKFDDNGNQYRYEVKEVEIDTDKYVQTYNNSSINNTNLINTLVTNDVSVTKQWQGLPNEDIKRPIKVALYKYSYNENNSSDEEDFGESEKGDIGLEEEGSDSGENSEDTAVESGDNSDDIIDSSTKIDIDDLEHIRDALDTKDIKLVDKNMLGYQNIEPIVELSTENSYTYKWGPLPAYENNGDKIIYLPYEVEVDSNNNIIRRLDNQATTSDEQFYVTYNGNIITNTYNMMALNATKVWDNSDSDELAHRPESIDVKVNQIAGNVKHSNYKENTLTKDNWYCTFDNIPIKSDGGEDYRYEILEVYGDSTIQEGGIITIDNRYQYIVTYSPSVLDGNNKDIEIKNTWKPVEKLDVTVEKIWNLKDGTDKPIGKIDSIRVALYRDDVMVEEPVTLKANNNINEHWKYTWTDLEKYKNVLTQEKYNYTVRELKGNEKIDGGVIRLNDLDKYEITYKDENLDNGDKKTEITNSFKAIDKIKVTVQKHWNDDIDKGAKDPSYKVKAGRPEFITVALYRDGVKYGDNLKLRADKDGKSDSELPWVGEWTNLPKYHVENGNEILYTYTIKELDKDENPLENKMTYRFDGTHKYEIRYGGTVSSPPDDAYNKNITNSYIDDPVKDLVVTKYWKDEDNNLLDNFNKLEGEHLEEVKVRIYRSIEGVEGSEKLFKELTLSALNNWSETIKNVDVNDLQDRKYIYRAVELDKNDNELVNDTKIRLNDIDKFKVNYDNYTQGPDDKLGRITEFFDITNTYIAPELIDVTVNKQWAGEGIDYINKRPTWVWFKLFKRVPGGIKEAVDKDLVVVRPDSDGNWSHTWENLKKYDLNDEEYEYSVTEYYTEYTYYLPPVGEQVSIKEMPLDRAVRLEGSNRDKYLVHYSPSVDTQDGKLITVTNTYEEPAMGNLIIEKEWVGISANEHPSEIQAIIHGQSGNKSEDITEIVELNTSNDFKTTLSVPYYDKYGRLYTYSVYEYIDNREIRTNSIIKLDNKKYQVKIEIRSSDGAFIISNIYQPPETIEVSVNKIWNDDTDLRNEHLEHTNVNVRLYQNDDVLMKSITLNEVNNYRWSAQLPKYKEDANETPYIYRFVELDKDGNELNATDKCRFNGTDQYEISYDSSGNNSETWNITNTFVPPTRTQVSVIKEWKNDIPSQRPENIKVQLYVKEEGSDDIKTVGSLETLSEDNSWEYTWDELLVNTTDDREIKYVYFVKEMNGSQPIEDTVRFNGTDKYQVNYSSDAYGYNNIITNSFIEPDTTNVKVIKHWLKNGIEHEPENVNEIKVQLYSYEKGYGSPKKYGKPVVLTKDNDWTYEWSNLLILTNDDRETPYTYTVKELFNEQELESGAQVRFNGVDKYEVSYEKPTSSSDYDLNITNIWIEPPTLNLEIEKDWGETPEDYKLSSISINLYQKDKDNNEVKFGDTIVLNADNDWHTSLVVPAQDSQDRDYTYRIAEVINDKELADKEIIRFNGNDKYQVEYFRGIINENQLIAKNTFIPRDIIDINVKKEWKDTNESTRPSSIIVELLRNGERFTQDDIITKVELNADNNWSYTWNNLYQAELKDDFNDVDYVYSVVEVFNDRDLKENEIVRLNGVDKYRVNYSSDDSKKNWIIMNSFVNPTMKKIVVDKVWDGGDDSKRSESVTINLYRDGIKFDSVELNTSNDWHHEWNLEAERLDDSLYKYTLYESLNDTDLKDGDIVKFNDKSKYIVSYKVDKKEVVEEIPREDDTLTNDSYTITNIYKAPDTKVISVEKIWDESDRTEGEEIIYTDITINLYRDDILFDTVVLNNNNEYRHNWTVDVHQEDENDTPYTYRLVEVFNGQDLSEGAKVRFNGVDKYEVGYDHDEDNWKITNKYLSPIMKEITVEKKWENDAESTRPDEIVVNLYQDTTLFDTVSLNSSNGWKYTWSVQVERNDDTLFDYNIKEVFKGRELKSGEIVRLNGVDKYQVGYPENKEDMNTFIITNTYIEPTMKDIYVEKVWIDNDVTTRPDGIDVGLYQDSELIETVRLDDNNEWKHIWSVEVERNDDSLYEYEIAEMFNGKKLEKGSLIRFNGIDKYLVDYEDISEDSYRITNRFIEPDMTSVRVEKIWVDTAKISRPTEITVRLYQDNLVYDTAVLNEGNNWSTTWIVPVNRLDDSKYVYSVREVYNNKDLVEGEKAAFGTKNEYEVSYSTISENNFRISNTQEVTDTPPGGGGSKESEPPKEPEVPKKNVPETPRPENPVPNIQRSIKDPLIKIYDIMDNMIPMTQTPAEIEDNETPLFGLPGTGDKTNIGKYILLCLISALGLFGLAFKNKKEEED